MEFDRGFCHFTSFVEAHTCILANFACAKKATDPVTNFNIKSGIQIRHNLSFNEFSDTFLPKNEETHENFN